LTTKKDDDKATNVGKTPNHKSKNSSSKLIFAQNVLSKIKKKDDKKEKPKILEMDNEDGASSRRVGLTESIEMKREQDSGEPEDWDEKQKAYPKPPPGKKRFIDYIYYKKAGAGKSSTKESTGTISPPPASARQSRSSEKMLKLPN
jgi:hypothetical protein